MDNNSVLPVVTLAELQANLPIMSQFSAGMFGEKPGETPEQRQASAEKFKSGLQFTAMILSAVPQLAREMGMTTDQVMALPTEVGLPRLAASLGGITPQKLHALFLATADAGRLCEAALNRAAARG